MNHAAQSMTLFDLCWLPFRHWKKTAAIFLVVLSATVAAIVMLPRSYRSEARLFVRLGRESVALDPTATTGQTMPVNSTRESEINSVLEMLRNRAILEKVVDAIGPPRILGYEGEAAPPDPLPIRLLRNLDPVDDRERAVNRLEQDLDVAAIKKSNILLVSFKAGSPKLAQECVSTLINEYLNRHAEFNRTHGSYEFFVTQSELLKQQMDEAYNELRDAKNESGVLSIESQREVLQNQISTVLTDLVANESKLAESEGAIKSLKELISKQPERMTTAEVHGFPNNAADDMRRVLYELELRERQLSAKYSADHPLVVEIRRQLADGRKIVEDQEPRRTQTTSDINPAHQDLLLKLLNQEATVASLRTKNEALISQRDRLQRELQELNTHELRIAELTRKAELLEANYRSYATNLEQARVDQALQEERISNVNVIQPATFVSKPVSPQKLMLLAAGFCFALLSSFGVALASESRDRSLQTPADVESKLKLPVLLSIPRVTEGRTAATASTADRA